MKIIWILILLPILSYGQSVDTVSFDDLEWSEKGPIYKIGSDKPFTGYLKNINHSGKWAYWHEEASIVNGRPEGLWTRWSRNDEIIETRFYEKGELIRESDFYTNYDPFFNPDTLRIESIDVLVNGAWVQGGLNYWYMNGQKKSERLLKDGVDDGHASTWYKNGQKETEGNYKHGSKDGLWTSWYSNGQKQSEGTYNGSQEGYLEYPEGLWTEWYDNGQKKSESLYKDGEEVSRKAWYENGQTIHISNENQSKRNENLKYSVWLTLLVIIPIVLIIVVFSTKSKLVRIVGIIFLLILAGLWSMIFALASLFNDIVDYFK